MKPMLTRLKMSTKPLWLSRPKLKLSLWPEAASEAKCWPEAASEAKCWPEAAPEAKFWPEAAPEAKFWPEAVPEANLWPKAGPEAKFWPEAAPKANLWPKASPEAKFRPKAWPEAMLWPEATPKVKFWVLAKGGARGHVLAKSQVFPFSLTKYCATVLKDKEYFGIAGHNNHLLSSIRIQNQTFHYQLWSSPTLKNHN
jgi:hypothetical protein